MDQPGLYTCGINQGLQLHVNSVLFCFIAFYQTPVLKEERGFHNLQKVGIGKLHVVLLSAKSENYFHQVSFAKPFLGS